jgi:hypothetical protein
MCSRRLRMTHRCKMVTSIRARSILVHKRHKTCLLALVLQVNCVSSLPGSHNYTRLHRPMTFAGSRLSRASLGLYAPSAPSYSDSTRQETVFTADGHDVIKRSKSKPASKRQSKASFDDKKRESAASFIGLAYDGEDPTAAAPVEYNHVLEETSIMNPGFQGRTRVKSGYFAAGTYPRMSHHFRVLHTL